MKEIQKVVQKLSRVQESATGGVRTGTKYRILRPSILGDSINYLSRNVVEIFKIYSFCVCAAYINKAISRLGTI